ncbi:FAD-binding domain-containing protein [Byssothecium circinans]|uniref:FAD-binding domain-containing protein n=1 Tax=Byssothecium circinans TaxID=147558 RepID=A0A6A5TVQ5_9PLEO|nr:FAD-binding domain-containing protein [Byssothecium circinans]
MRGGGHMPIPGAATINSTGVQISSTNLKTLKLSEDKQTMSIGPGPRWGDVFEYLDGTNVTVVGGRLPPVGVPGLLLGGGISYFSNAHGLSATNGKIRAYEVVLADGTIATVTADCEYSDLYWALQGGGNSFGLVTRFDLKTFPLETTLRAEATYEESEETKDLYLDALLDYTINGDVEPGFAITPVARWGPNFTVPSCESTLLYNGSVVPSSGPAKKFYDGTIKSLNDTSTMKAMSLAEYSRLLRFAFEEGGPGHGFRQNFHVISAKATREGMDIIHDTWFSLLKERDLANHIPGFFAGLAYNSVTRTMAAKSKGSPQNIDVEPAFWVEEAISWSSAEYDAEIYQFVNDVNAEIESQLKAKDLMTRYIYLNDASKDQKAFKSYGTESVKKLKAIRAKYVLKLASVKY